MEATPYTIMLAIVAIILTKPWQKRVKYMGRTFDLNRISDPNLYNLLYPIYRRRQRIQTIIGFVIWGVVMVVMFFPGWGLFYSIFE